jgi:outer membrane protein OmpA-like peptidoglycan-associated protein
MSSDSMCRLLEGCLEARLDLDEDDEEWIALRWTANPQAILTTQPASNFTGKPRLTRSLTIARGDDYVVASAQPKPTVELHEIYFKFNSAALTADAKPQLRELGAALRDPRLKDSTISIAGHTDAVGSDAFNQMRASAFIGLRRPAVTPCGGQEGFPPLC